MGKFSLGDRRVHRWDKLRKYQFDYFQSLETLAELGKKDCIISKGIFKKIIYLFLMDIKTEIIVKKNRCSTEFCITLVLRDVSIAILLLFISDADLQGNRTKKWEEKCHCHSLVQHVPHVI